MKDRFKVNNKSEVLNINITDHFQISLVLSVIEPYWVSYSVRHTKYDWLKNDLAINRLVYKQTNILILNIIYVFTNLMKLFSSLYTQALFLIKINLKK